MQLRHLFLTTLATPILMAGAATAQTNSEEWPVLQPVKNAPSRQAREAAAMHHGNNPVDHFTYRNMGYGAPVIRSEGSGAIPALPLHIMVSPAGVYFVNGGIGDEEIQQLKSVDDEFNVHVLMSNPDGAYVSGKNLRMKNENGQEILNVDDAGPYVYIKLPAGTYTLQTYDNSKVVKTKTVKVREKGTTKEHLVFSE